MKINKKMQKFDLFRLHVPEEDRNSGKSWIRVKSNKPLCKELKNMINSARFLRFQAPITSIQTQNPKKN